jgi:tetratricopeptide (TPR) repeat protein
MGVNSRFNFEGGYENDTQAGMLHVASHHFSPGKKQWTWGNGDFGRAWDRNLTDCVGIDDGKLKTENCVGTQQTDKKQAEGNFQLSTLRSQLRPGFRPYIELMAGVYTENQPDFTWLMPYEEKSFVQYFMPYRELGVVKQASKDLIMNIEQVDELSTIVRFKVFATSKQEVRIVLRNDDGTIYYNKVVTITPEEVLTEAVDVKSAKFNELTFDIFKTFVYGERSVLSWHAESDDIRPIPDSAEAALQPEEVKTNEQLYLTGLHLEQYRHATWLATDYYEEALRRDPNDIRCLNAMGLWYIRKGRFALAEEYLRKAVKLLQKRNPNPYDGEPIYNLALSLKYQQKYAEAYELFWKATWNKGWADAGYFEAAKISTMQGRYEDALDEVNRCLVSNWHNHKARALKTAILRKLRKMEEAISLIEESLAFDLFNYGCMYEHYLIRKDQAILDKMKQMMRQSGQNYDELALDYKTAGLDEEANAIWNIAISEGATSPMTYYYMNSLTPCSTQRDACRSKNLSPKDEGSDYLCKAETMLSDYCFPNRPEDIIALERAKRENPKGSKAPYYLGCLYYAARQYDLATRNWQLSADIDPKFPTVWRNLALTAYNKQHNREQALEYMQRAFHLDETDARILMELDQLYKVTQMPHVQRLAFLRQYPKLLSQRDDLVLEEITLLNQVGSYEEAMQKLDAHIFHPWEGGEGKVPAQYQKCRVELAKKAIFNKEYEHAIILLSQCLAYPPHLGEGKLYGAQENDFYYLQGIAYDALGNEKMAHECWQRATEGPTEPAAAMYYNDAKPDKIFYAGLAYRKLGEENAARRLFNRLVDYGEKHLFDTVRMDYFAVSLPDLLIWDGDLGLKNTIHCNLMMALGHLGLGNTEKGLRFLEEVERLDINHGVPSDVRSLLRMVEK